MVEVNVLTVRVDRVFVGVQVVSSLPCDFAVANTHVQVLNIDHTVRERDISGKFGH